MSFFKILLFFILTQSLFPGRMDVNASKIEAEIDRVHFIGNAEIKVDGSSIHAEKVSVYLDDKNETRYYEASGDVRFFILEKNYYFKGRANNISYNMFTQRYVMTGMAVVEDNNFLMKRYIAGDEIIFDLFTETVEVDGGSISTNFFIKLNDIGNFFGL